MPSPGRGHGRTRGSDRGLHSGARGRARWHRTSRRPLGPDAGRHPHESRGGRSGADRRSGEQRRNRRHLAAFTDAPDDELRQVTEVNYLAPAELCRQAIPRMLRRGGGHIVNVSSMAGLRRLPRPGRLLGIEGGAFPLHRGAACRPPRLADRHHPRRSSAPIPTDMLAESEDDEPTADPPALRPHAVSSSTSPARKWPTRS